MRASAVAEQAPAAEAASEKTGRAFAALKDIEAIQEVLPHRWASRPSPVAGTPCVSGVAGAPVLLRSINMPGCLLPCRYPFLLVDRVVELEPQKFAVGYKCVSANDNFFTGHFPERKIMPGERMPALRLLQEELVRVHGA